MLRALHDGKYVIGEFGQSYWLDKRHGFSPNVTASHTFTPEFFQSANIPCQPVHVVVGSDALDAAHGAGPEPGPGPVGDAQVHRYADERDVQSGEIADAAEPQGRADEGRHPLVGLGPAVSAGKHQLAHLAEVGVAREIGRRPGVGLAQLLQLLGVHCSALAVAT